MSFAGGQLLMDTTRATGLGAGLRTALAMWRRDRTRHDPGKVVLDLATSIALGGDCLADVAVPAVVRGGGLCRPYGVPVR